MTEQDAATTTPATMTAATEHDAAATAGSGAADDLAALREALLRGYPETAPELAAGTTVAELLASLEPAALAWRRAAEAARAAGPAAVSPPRVPAGNAAPIAIDPETLPATEKIRRALAGRTPRPGTGGR